MMLLVLQVAIAWDPTPSQAALYRAVAVRDPEPSCGDLASLSSELVADLTVVVREVDMPPWAPMRAATCLVTHHAEAAEGELLSWLVDPGLEGLAKLLCTRIDVLPNAVREHVAKAGLAGPHATSVRPLLGASEHEEVRALLGERRPEDP